jgi:hypothetical protein
LSPDEPKTTFAVTKKGYKFHYFYAEMQVKNSPLFHPIPLWLFLCPFVGGGCMLSAWLKEQG